MKIKYEYTDELDNAIGQYCVENFMSITKFMESNGMTYANFYACRRYGTIGTRMINKLKGSGLNFDFSSLPVKFE